MTESRWGQVRATALSLPRAIEDFPWGESVIKVNHPQRRYANGLAVGPMFVWLGLPERAAVAVKLTASYDEAVAVSGAAPTTMSGLGQWGWLTVPLAKIDLDLIELWLEESYRNVTPKWLAAELVARRPI